MPEQPEADRAPDAAPGTVSDREGEDDWAGPPSLPVLWGSAVLSGLLLLIPAYLLAWFWPGVQRGATCDLVHQPFCRPGYGLPQWYAVAAVGVSSCALHVATAVRWPRRVARSLSACGLAAAVLAWLLATVARSVLSGLVPDSWFMT
jgi:hypothetical protein